MKTVYKSKNIIAVIKPAGTPTEPDSTGSLDAMSLIRRELSSVGESDTLYLVHRLDLPVGGLVVFARNKKSAAELSELFAMSGVKKEYLAVVEGECASGVFIDYLIKSTALKKAVIAKVGEHGAKLSELYFDALGTAVTEKGARTLVKVSLKTGRFHQIRAQFSSRGLPLVGDKKYGSRDRGATLPSLFCHRLSFSTQGESVDITAIPDTESYPWSLFDRKIFEDIKK